MKVMWVLIHIGGAGISVNVAVGQVSIGVQCLRLWLWKRVGRKFRVHRRRILRQNSGTIPSIPIASTRIGVVIPLPSGSSVDLTGHWQGKCRSDPSSWVHGRRSQHASHGRRRCCGASGKRRLLATTAVVLVTRCGHGVFSQRIALRRQTAQKSLVYLTAQNGTVHIARFHPRKRSQRQIANKATLFLFLGYCCCCSIAPTRKTGRRPSRKLLQAFHPLVRSKERNGRQMIRHGADFFSQKDRDGADRGRLHDIHAVAFQFLDALVQEFVVMNEGPEIAPSLVVTGRFNPGILARFGFPPRARRLPQLGACGCCIIGISIVIIRTIVRGASNAA